MGGPGFAMSFRGPPESPGPVAAGARNPPLDQGKAESTRPKVNMMAHAHDASAGGCPSDAPWLHQNCTTKARLPFKQSLNDNKFTNGPGPKPTVPRVPLSKKELNEAGNSNFKTCIL